MKKLKGHASIILENTETGKIRRYEEDNMVTNAISKMMNFAAKNNLDTNPLNPYSIHWENLLGGLVLFDSALEEDADNIYPSAGIKPVGYGIVGDTNSYTGYAEWGYYNPQESDTSQSTVKKMAWTFDTTKANRRIASVALTHKNNGLFGFGADTWHNTGRNMRGKIALGSIFTQSSKGKQSQNFHNYGVTGTNLLLENGSYVDFCIDAENDEKYMVKVCQNGISIIKHKIYPEVIDLFASSTNYQSYTEEQYSGEFSGTYFYTFYNPDEKALYFWLRNSDENTVRTNGTLSIVIHKFDMETKTLTSSWKTLTIPKGSYTPYNGIIYFIYSMVIKNEAIYVMSHEYNSANTYYLLKYNTASGSVSVIMSRLNTDSQTNGIHGHTSRICKGLAYFEYFLRIDTSSINASLIIDTSDDSVRYTNINNYCYGDNAPSYGTCIPPIDNTQIVHGTMLDSGVNQNYIMTLQQSGSDNTTLGNAWAPVNYLGTINNLAEPIIKTATDVLKVEYTISMVEE